MLNEDIESVEFTIREKLARQTEAEAFESGVERVIHTQLHGCFVMAAIFQEQVIRGVIEGTFQPLRQARAEEGEV